MSVMNVRDGSLAVFDHESGACLKRYNAASGEWSHVAKFGALDDGAPCACVYGGPPIGDGPMTKNEVAAVLEFWQTLYMAMLEQ